MSCDHWASLGGPGKDRVSCDRSVSSGDLKVRTGLESYDHREGPSVGDHEEQHLAGHYEESRLVGHEGLAHLVEGEA